MTDASRGLDRRQLCLAAAFSLATGSTAAFGATAVPAGEFEKTPLARLAAQLKPGEMRPLQTRLPDGVTQFGELLAGIHRDGRRAPPIDTWTDSAYWDPLRKRTFFQGLRKSNRFISYRAVPNVWEEISLLQENAPPTYEQFGHLYGRTALDWRRGHFYRLVGANLHRYVIDEDRWEAFRGGPLYGTIAISFHEAMDMVVGTTRHKLHGFGDGRWQPLGQTRVHGYHSSAKYNPKRRDMLFIGGNESRNTVDLLTANGQIRALADAPFTFGISQDDLTHDPITGHYLVLHRSRMLWEHHPEQDEWRVALDLSGNGGRPWPFGGGGVVPIPIDELGVIFWQLGGHPLIYRHRSVFT
jgi:hypothetical protein